MGEKSVNRNFFIDNNKLLQKSTLASSEPPEIENEVKENELIELMEFLPLPRNDDFATMTVIYLQNTAQMI